MLFNSVERRALLKKIEQLEQEKIHLEQRLQARDNEFKEYVDSVHDKNRSADMSFDFKLMRAFSVERIYDHNHWKTIVGYLRPGTDEVGEWSFHCSIERHNEIAAAFAEYIKGKKSEVSDRKRNKR